MSTSVAMLIPRDHRTGEAPRHVSHQALLAEFTIFWEKLQIQKGKNVVPHIKESFRCCLSLLISLGISLWSLILFLVHDLLFQHSPCCLEHCSTCTYKIHGKAIEKWQKQLNVLCLTHSELKFLKWCWFWPQYLWRRR